MTSKCQLWSESGRSIRVNRFACLTRGHYLAGSLLNAGQQYERNWGGDRPDCGGPRQWRAKGGSAPPNRRRFVGRSGFKTGTVERSRARTEPRSRNEKAPETKRETNISEAKAGWQGGHPVRPAGFEPATLGSEDRCAIQLRQGAATAQEFKMPICFVQHPRNSPAQNRSK